MQDSLHFQLMITQNAMYREILGKAMQLGLSPGQPKILEYLSEHNGCLQQDMARDCRLNKSTIAGIVRRMEYNDLIRRTVDPADGRGVLVQLTPKGKEGVRQMEEIFSSIERKALQDISPEETSMLIELLKKLRGNLLHSADEAKK